jgi:hypothetical protein
MAWSFSASFPNPPDYFWWLSRTENLASDVSRQARDRHNR